MKHLLIILLMIVSVFARGQGTGQVTPSYSMPSASNEPTVQFHYLLAWRVWESGWKQHGDVMGMESSWVTHWQDFATKQEILAYINGSNQYSIGLGEPQDTIPRIAENQIIGVYDLKSATVLRMVYHTQTKTVPKHVEVKQSKWTVQKAEFAQP